MNNSVKEKWLRIGPVFLFLWLSCALALSGAVKPTHAVEEIHSRPNADTGPTRVEVFMWLIDIDSINSAQQNFVVNLFITLRWKDPRLAHGRKYPQRYEATDVWTPRVQIANEIGIVRWTMGNVVDVDGDGTITYRQRYVGPLSQPLNLRDFPFDKHLFRIHLIPFSGGIGKDDIEFVPSRSATKSGMAHAAGIAEEISLPDWIVESYATRPLPYTLAQDVAVPGYALEFIAKRDSRYYVWKVCLPLILIVMISWVSFWIDPKEITTNVTIAMTSMLTLVAYRFSFEGYLPKVGYLTRLDYFMFWTMLLVFINVIQVAANSRLVLNNRRQAALKIDLVARFLYPVALAAIALWSLVL